jgi:hypothetical protein
MCEHPGVAKLTFTHLLGEPLIDQGGSRPGFAGKNAPIAHAAAHIARTLPYGRSVQLRRRDLYDLD